MRILVTGGTGLVGRRLIPMLRERGHEILVLSRQTNPNLPPGCQALAGDPALAGSWLDEIDRCDAVFHLAGENLFARRWRKHFKQQLHDSRVESTKMIAERMSRSPMRDDGTPKVFIVASAVGYYGLHDSDELDESSPPGNDFLARLCVDWEHASQPAAAAGVRVAHPRFGVVLDRDGGALPKLAGPFRCFVGGYIGNGKQWISWIHATDLASLLLFILDRPEIAGPINATAPEPLTNWGLSKMLGTVLHRPCWLRVPAWALRVMLGEAAILVTRGQRVLPQRAVKMGFEFQFADIQLALKDLL